MIDISSLSLTRLDPSTTRKPFDCNDNDLNDFFYNDSINSDQKLLTVTFILEDAANTVAFFSLLNDKIGIEDAPSKSWWRKHIRGLFPHGKEYNSYPAVKIGRIGVHKDFQSQGLGAMIIDYIKRLFHENNKSGCRFITVDSYNNERTLNFYEENGFNYLLRKSPTKEDKTRLMYFDLMSLLED